MIDSTINLINNWVIINIVDIYVIGGATRDILLGNRPKDIDYVVVNSSHDEMIALNFMKVGAGFPVYLHPETGDEFALARTETKQGVGYLGFDVFTENVSLADDQGRRDLTINQLAVRIEDWDNFVKTRDESLILDAFGGIQDLKAGILRHNTKSFQSDPIRVLRCARLSARYNFDVHPDTIELMKKVVPELYTVPQERIWAEFEKGLMEEYPARMFEVLRECGALRFNGPLAPYCSVNIEALQRVTDLDDICVRFALISQNFDDRDFETCRIPAECAKISSAFHLSVGSLSGYLYLSTSARLYLLERLKAFNDDWTIRRVLHAWECLGHINYDDVVFNIARDLTAVRKVDCAAIAELCTNGKEIKQKIFEARIRAMEEL